MVTKVVGRLTIFFLIVSISLVYLPSFWVHVFILIDFYTPWVLFESKLYDRYHHFLVDRLPERPEVPLIEISASEANTENIRKLSKDYTWPVVIRGLLGNASTNEAIRSWHDPNWWMERYPNEELLCGTLNEVVENCTVAAFFQAIENGKPFYISGASVIFDNNPMLHDMIDNEQIRSIEPGFRTATQVFMGVPTMGSDIHAAMGINIFRQIIGEKKWWFIPPSQTAYLKPSINVNGFSAHTHTLVGKEGGTPSPWMTKLERYTSVLHPGDVLINPPWFWHGIVNLGDAQDKRLVVGCPSRYSAGSTGKPALLNNPLFTFNTMVTIIKKYGLRQSLSGKVNLQADIANNRRGRESKPLVPRTTEQSLNTLDLGE